MRPRRFSDRSASVTRAGRPTAVLREELVCKGYSFATETDSEIAAFVVEDELGKGKPPAEAVHAALGRLKGAFALVYLFEGQDNLLIGARKGALLSRISIIGCGTAYMAGLIGKYWIEHFARLPVEIDVASEYRYREAPVEQNGLTIVISQSGETADTMPRCAMSRRTGRTRSASSMCPIPALRG